MNQESSGEEKNQNAGSDDSLIMIQSFILDKSQADTESSKYFMSEEEVREIITRYNTDLSNINLYSNPRRNPIGK